ncbi:MAG TPA: acetate kinase [Chitinophagaceae bacterium]|mgnify:CR=1 FL=1|jgi:acetate kinase|nr:acetate kinase [Chitinophagaceae bacterium]
MKIFVINSGSSSLKYQLIEMPEASLLCSGLVDRIGLDNATLTHKTYLHNNEQVIKENKNITNHNEALQYVVELLTQPAIAVIEQLSDIKVVGHRVVHGGINFSTTITINQAVKDKIVQLIPLAPLHLPANFTGIEVAEKIFTSATQIAVFDTAFHQTMPPKAYRYAIPQELFTKNHIRAYGFHGTSHKYVSAKAMEFLQNTQAKIITIHLGNGSSMTAVDAGNSIDTTMGLGPLGGLIMGTRSGDIDPTIIFHLVNALKYDLGQVDHLLNKKSGLLGFCGFSDMREVKKAIAENNEDAALIYEMSAYRIKKYIGAYAAALGGLDAIVFTGGIGENDATMRALAVKGLEFLGIEVDVEKNQAIEGGIQAIQTTTSKVQVLVVPTNEELEIANQCYALLAEAK